MRICSKHELARSRVALLSKCNVAYALVVHIVLKVFQVSDIVEVLEILLVRKLTNDVEIPVGHGILREDIMVWDKNNLLLVPHLGVLPKLCFESLDHGRSADVVRHETGDVRPDILAGIYEGRLGMLCDDFFSERHGLFGGNGNGSDSLATMAGFGARSWRRSHRHVGGDV